MDDLRKYSGSGMEKNGMHRSPDCDNIVDFTEKVLSSGADAAVVCSDGRVKSRNRALHDGDRDYSQLVKERVWGGDDSAPVFCVAFSDRAWNRILTETLKERRCETGGPLIGHIQNEQDGAVRVVVERTSGPGLDADQRTALLHPDLKHYRERVNYYHEHRDWDYLGEWHKHPGYMTSLSAQDLRTAGEVMEEEGRPFLVLPVAVENDGFLEVNVYVVYPLKTGREGVGVQHVGCNRMAVSTIRRSAEMKVYVNRKWISDFTGGAADMAEYSGLCNQGESYVFLSRKGRCDARLRLVRGGRDVPLRDDCGQVTGILLDDGMMHYYTVIEGETVELETVSVDPEVDVYSRNSGLLETTALRDRTVAIVGCGSVGSTIALELARAGVGCIHLIDPDRLEPHNIARHQAGISDLGRPKVEAVADMVGNICPAIDVRSHMLDVVEDGDAMNITTGIAEECDLIICTTDTDASRVFINDLSLEEEIPSLHVGLHERAHSGIVQAVWPGRGACFMCHRDSVLNEGAKRGAVAYSEAEDVRDLTVQPGLSAQINVVAETGALRAIDMLMKDLDADEKPDFPELTLIYIDSQEETGPRRRLYLRYVHFEMEANPDCPACGAEAEEIGDLQAVEEEI